MFSIHSPSPKAPHTLHILYHPNTCLTPSPSSSSHMPSHHITSPRLPPHPQPCSPTTPPGLSSNSLISPPNHSAATPAKRHVTLHRSAAYFPKQDAPRILFLARQALAVWIRRAGDAGCSTARKERARKREDMVCIVGAWRVGGGNGKCLAMVNVAVRI